MTAQELQMYNTKFHRNPLDTLLRFNMRMLKAQLFMVYMSLTKMSARLIRWNRSELLDDYQKRIQCVFY
jgi:hypothetical protein